MLTILVIIIVAVMMLGVVLGVLGAGLDLLISLLASLLNFLVNLLLPLIAGALVTLALFFLLRWLLRSLAGESRSTDAAEMLLLALAAAAGVAALVLTGLWIRDGYGGALQRAELAANYKIPSGEVSQSIEEAEQMEALRALLKASKIRGRYFIHYMPGYLSSLFPGNTQSWIGLYEADKTKLVEVILTDGKQIGIARRGGKVRWYRMNRQVDAEAVAKLFSQAEWQRKERRVHADNDAAIDAFFDAARYADGHLLLTVDGFVSQSSLRVEVNGVAQRENNNLLFQDLDLKVSPGDALRVPVPQGRLFRELYVSIAIDGVSVRRDLADLLPEDMRVKSAR